MFSEIIRNDDKVDRIYQASEKLNINTKDKEEIKKIYRRWNNKTNKIKQINT